MKRLKIIVLLIILSISCKKNTELEVCNSNCKQVSIKGRITDAYSDKGIESLNYQIIFKTFRGNPTGFPGPTYPSKLIYQGNTPQNGVFTINTIVDSTYFDNYSLKLITPELNNYFHFFSDYSLSSNDSVNIWYYPSTTLKVNLKKTQIRNYDYINLTHNWKINKLDITNPRPWINSFTGNADTTFILQVPIETNIKFNLDKEINNSGTNTIRVVDSIYINKNNANEITINF
jgi:hypothetical protein